MISFLGNFFAKLFMPMTGKLLQTLSWNCCPFHHSNSWLSNHWWKYNFLTPTVKYTKPGKKGICFSLYICISEYIKTFMHILTYFCISITKITLIYVHMYVCVLDFSCFSSAHACMCTHTHNLSLLCAHIRDFLWWFYTVYNTMPYMKALNKYTLIIINCSFLNIQTLNQKEQSMWVLANKYKSNKNLT